MVEIEKQKYSLESIDRKVINFVCDTQNTDLMMKIIRDFRRDKTLKVFFYEIS